LEEARGGFKKKIADEERRVFNVQIAYPLHIEYKAKGKVSNRSVVHETFQD
jgi:hypothetical protein